MISGQARNVKSGWKSVFAVLTAAAEVDERPETASLAFEIVERVIREHFDRITETDPSTFADCVDCLIAFTRHAKDGADGVVALNAVAFLRFCALKLADGAIGDLEKGVESAAVDAFGGVDGDKDARSKSKRRKDQKTKSVSRPVARARGADRVHRGGRARLLLVPASEGPLRSHLRRAPRFDAPRWRCSSTYWTSTASASRPGSGSRRTTKSCSPIFDRVRFHDEDGSEKQDEGEDSWVFQTTQRCLDLLVDLTAKRRERILTTSPPGRKTLGALFDLFVSLCLTSSKKLASCGVGAMHRLLSSLAGDALDEHGWSVAVDALARAMEATKPDVSSLLVDATDPSDGAERGSGGASTLRAIQKRGETCTLLAHAAAETYFAYGSVLSAASLGTLVDALLSVATRASSADAEAPFLDVAATLPPLLALEIQSCRASLAVLLHLHAAKTTRGKRRDEDERRRRRRRRQRR